jgi:hypothetical protein
MLVPEFLLTVQEKEIAFEKEYFTKALVSKFTTEPINYFVCPPKREKAFLTSLQAY